MYYCREIHPVRPPKFLLGPSAAAVTFEHPKALPVLAGYPWETGRGDIRTRSLRVFPRVCPRVTAGNPHSCHALSPLLSPNDPSPAVPFVIWYSPIVYRKAGEAASITILSQDLANDILQATHCTAYNATYDVGINLEEGSTTAQVWDISLDSVLVLGNTFISTYTKDALEELVGYIYAGPNGYINNIFGGQVQHNTFFGTTQTGNHSWNGKISDFLTSYMQNVSISLLSAEVHYRFSKGAVASSQYVNSTCSSTFTVYDYDAPRLLFVYGVVLVVAALIVVLGCSLILRNGSEEKIAFSHIVQIALDERLFRISGDVSAKSQMSYPGVRSSSITIKEEHCLRFIRITG